MTHLTLDDCRGMDARDPLAPLREQFELPPGVIYLDGNSLGAMPKASLARAREVITQEWGTGLIRSWNTAGWFELPRRLGNKLGRLIGASDGEVVVTDTTSIYLFKVLAADEIGMHLTESLAMFPASSVSGFYLGHPDSVYFNVGQIGEDQLKDMAERRGIDLEEMRRALAPNLG